LGQFFTPPRVAQFVWEVLEIVQGAKFSPRTRMIDPACGEGVFLRVAAEFGGIEADCLFGADIDPTLAAGWRGQAHLQHAHLLVANGLLDHPARGLRAGGGDLVVGNPPFAGKGVRDVLRLLDDADAAAAIAETDLFGALVLQEKPTRAGPPLTPSERAELDQLVRALGCYQCWQLTRESPQNGDKPDENETAELFDAAMAANSARPNGSAEIARAAGMVTAWPLNRPLDPRRPETRFLLRRLASTAIEVFFMERFVQLAKPGGLIALIVPESIVASDQLGPLRTWLRTQMQLLAVVSLPQKVFAGVGANAKTSIVFARRRLRTKPGNRRLPAGPPADAPAAAEAGDDGPALLMAAPGNGAGAPGFNLDDYLADVLKHLRRNDPPPALEPPRGQIGFHVKPDSQTASKRGARRP
jgi:hypothetical protein